MARRTAILIGVFVAALIGGAALAMRLLSGDTPPASSPSASDVRAAVGGWAGPVRVERPGAAVETLRPAADGSLAWSEAPDTAPRWADVASVGVITDFQNWRLELGLEHPRRDELTRAGQVLAFGFVIDTNADGVADYVVGIDNDAEAPAVRVWLTNLATGETDENATGPYGDPFDFATSLEGDPIPGDRPRPPGSSFFDVGFAPPGLFDYQTVRFYAWSSLTEDGEVVAWDYAPNTNWLGAQPSERLGCEPLACPLTGPDPGSGAREWIVSVENRSTRDALLFVAKDESPMGELVGTAVPASVAPGATQRVVFTVPDGLGWAIFVNPSATAGPQIIAQDAPPDAAGVLPIAILVHSNGMAGVSVPAGIEGWFGN